MPSNIFATTGTNVSILFIDKNNQSDDVLLMDASKLGSKIKEGKNQKTVLSKEEIEKIETAFINKEEIEDFSVVVKFDELKNKNCSFAPSQYFEVKIKYSELTPEEFEKEINDKKELLNLLFDKSKDLEVDLMSKLEDLKYDRI